MQLFRVKIFMNKNVFLIDKTVSFESLLDWGKKVFLSLNSPIFRCTGGCLMALLFLLESVLTRSLPCCRHIHVVDQSRPSATVQHS